MEKTILIKCKGAELVDFEDLTPFQGNLKDLSESNLEKLKKEIIELGFSEPLSVWKSEGTNWLLNGHQRHRVIGRMIQDGWKCPPLPISIIEAESAHDAKLKVLALTSQFGEITSKGLYEFVSDSGLSFEDVENRFRFPEINFEKWKSEFFSEDNLVSKSDPEACPEPPKEPKTRRGDLYQLDRHRLKCGDATSTEDLKSLMSDSMADLVWTDPPYNINYSGKTKQRLAILNDNMSNNEFYEFLYDSFTNMLIYMKSGAAFYVAHADTEGYTFRKALAESTLQIRQCLIWVKNIFSLSRSDYHWRHEPILYGWKDGAAHNWFGDRAQDTILEFNKPSRSEVHPTMKPIDLIEYCVKNSSKANDLVLDIFGGSGSTLIACEKNQRTCHLMELDPKYCDVIVDRWETFTGKKAKLLTNENPNMEGPND